jgi:hypothetical protein
MRKKRKPSLWLTVGAAVLLIGGGTVAYWLWVQRKTSVGNFPIGAQLVPQDALVAASITTDPKQWEQLREYGTSDTQAVLDQQLATLRDNFLTVNGYDYQKDIQPWVGKEIMLAYLSSEVPVSPPNAKTPTSVAPVTQLAMVMLLPIENPVQAQQLLDKPDSQKTRFIERTYKGVQIRERQGGTSQISTTVIDRFLVVSTDPKATDRIIDTYKGEASLAATPGYPQALGQIQASEPFAQMYVNVPTAAAVAASNSARSLSPQNLAQVQQKQGIAATVTLEGDGIRFKGVSWLKPNSQKQLVVENKAKSMPNRLPGETLLMVSGGNLQQLWQDYREGAESNPVTPIKPEDLRARIKFFSGLDLDQDLLPWMKGEFSLALIPAPKGTPSELGAGIVLMIQASDRSQAEKSLNQLDEYVAKQYQFQAQKAQIEGQPVVNLTSPLGGLTATHGWLDNNVAFLTVGAPITNLMLPQPKSALIDNELFKKAVSTELSPNNGHFFMDVDHTINAGNLTLSPLTPQSPQQNTFFKLLTGVRGVGVTAAVHDERSSRFDLFVVMKKVGQPNPSPTPPAKSP